MGVWKIDRTVAHPSSVGRRIRSGVLAGVLVSGALVAGGGTAASAQTGGGLGAWVSYERFAVVPAPTAPGSGLTQSVPATQTQAGSQGWRLSLTNTTSEPVTDPAIAVDSGWAPSLFPGLAGDTQACPQDVVRQGTEFPVTWTDTSFPLPGGPPALPYFCEPNQMLVDDLTAAAYPPNNPLVFTPGVDSSRSLDTTLVLPGGTQELTVVATVHDPSTTELILRSVVFATPETVASITPPTGLSDCPVPDPGTAPCIASLGHSDQAAQVNILHPVPGVAYSFSVAFTNGSPNPVNMIPATQVGTTVPRPLQTTATGNGLHVTDTTLDGSSPGRGAIEYSVGAGQAVEWTLASEVNTIVEYSGGNYAVPLVGGGHFVIGDLNAAVGDAVTFWGAQWAEDNGFSGGAAPAAFKGFASSPEGTAVCGAPWSGFPGNSAGAPLTVPAYMAVIVTASAGKSGPAISGTVTAIAIVRTDPGYSPRPGHPGTGTVVAVLPC